MPGSRKSPEPLVTAKLARPRPQGAYQRTRLLARLEASHAAPVLWVTGPPGAGKTTLLSTWLDSRPPAGLWYQLDERDADPARFFYLLREAAKKSGIRKLTRLPLLTPEYAQDVAGFARRWLRELFARLPPGATLTLDNYQELPADSVLHGALAEVGEEIPPGCRLVVLGWSAPPEQYFRLVRAQRLVEIGWHELKLSADELAGLGAVRGLDDEVLRRIGAQSDGWIAGFVLLCQRKGDFDGLGRVNWDSGLQSVFDYFTAQVFRRATPQQRDLMIKAAFFPCFTVPMLSEIGDGAVARELFEWLSRRQLFVDRHYGPEVTYQYHSLFRTFLKSQAAERYTRHGMAELCADIAGILERSGQYEEAIALHLEIDNWRDASALILKQAPELLATGRRQTLQRWVATLPDEFVAALPWLRYWLGMALLGGDPRKAQAVFDGAFASFLQQGDRRGQLLAAGGYVEAVLLAWGDLSPGLTWLPVIERLLADAGLFPSIEAEARICGVVLDFTFWAAPQHELLGRCAARVLDLLHQPLEVNQKLMTASYAIECFGTMGLAAESRRVIAAVADDLRHPALTDFSRCNWLVRQSYYQGNFGDYRELERAMSGLERLALENGFAFLLAPVYMRLADIHLARGEETPALETNDRRRRFVGWIDKPAMVSSIESRVAACRGELGPALEAAEAALADVRRRHFVIVEGLYESQLVSIRVLRGELEAARAMTMEILQRPAGLLTRMTEIRALANLAWIESRQGNEAACVEHLRAALARARQSEFTALARMTLLDRWLCSQALTYGIETSYVRGIVRNMGLLPEFPDVPQWPWPVQIFALGGFRVLREDQALEHARKAPQKPLALLKAIIAGGGRPVPLSRLADALWPDEDGDAAQQALAVALHRLRKLLGQEASVSVQEGQVSLDERYCWVDAHAYLRLSDRADQALQAGQAEACEALSARAMRLYRGGFLAADEPVAASVLFREQLRRRFMHQVARVGRRLDEAGRVDEALAVFEKGIEAEPLAENFYQQIMQCYLRAGRKAEGLNAYRRLREVLSIVLGIAPAAASEALYGELRG